MTVFDGIGQIGEVNGDGPLINILGEKIALGPFERENAPDLHLWLNDYAVMRMLDFLPGPRTHERAESPWDGLLAAEDNVAFGIYERAGWKLIGFSVLLYVDHINRSAEFGIAIGDVAAQGKGYGTEATVLTLDHGFTALGITNIMLRVFEYNRVGLHIYEKLGFRKIGTRRKSKMMGGKLWDTIYMEMLADEFESPVLRKILSPQASL